MKKEQINENGTFELTVKAVILNEENKVLVLCRSKENDRCPEKLDLPGGGVQEGENLEDALEREVREETGIQVEIGPIIYHVDWKTEDTRKNIFAKGFRVLAFYKGGEIKTSHEHGRFEWMGINEAINKFDDKGFEKDKRDALIKAKEYLELKNSLDSWKRCLADFENYRKMQAESGKELMNFATENLVLQMLPILDNFHASTDHVPEEQKDNAWVVGIMHIQKQLETFLKDNGVEEIEAKIGDAFNPELHEAVQGEKEVKKHKVAKIISKGYKINNKIIRAVKVIVE